MPLGARTLWPQMVTKSVPSSLGVKGTFKKPWTASVCRRAGEPAARMASAAARTGRREPTSLLTSIMDTRMVSGRTASATA